MSLHFLFFSIFSILFRVFGPVFAGGVFSFLKVILTS